jgi:uncharacterized protein DUF4124
MKAGSIAATVAAALLATATGVAAQTLYKLIDKDGKVTYSEKPPKDFDGKVVPLDIDPNRNTATLPKPAAAPAKTETGGPGKAGERKAPAKREEGQKGVDSDDRVQQAKDRLEAARKALEDAQNNPGPDDVLRVGKVGGGTRPVFSEPYANKLSQLEAKVKSAEEDLKRAEENR